MAHSPEQPTMYVCEHCHVVHAGTPVHQSGGEHSFDPPESCGVCGESSFVESQQWVHHHE